MATLEPHRQIKLLTLILQDIESQKTLGSVDHFKTMLSVAKRAKRMLRAVGPFPEWAEELQFEIQVTMHTQKPTPDWTTWTTNATQLYSDSILYLKIKADLPLQ